MKRLALAVATSVLAVTVTAGAGSPAAAAAVVDRNTTTSYNLESGLPDDCRPGITGDLSGTGVVTSQSVTTPTGFHIHGTDTGTGRIDWTDGSYSIIGSVDHFSFNTGTQATGYTDAHQDAVNTYSASGVFLFRLTYHEVVRFAVSGGVIHVQFTRGHFGGEC